MHAETRSIRRIGWGATTLALTATIAALSAPTASAIGPVQVYQCTSDPTSSSYPGPPCVIPPSYVVGQTYMLDSPITPNVNGDNAFVSFYDNGQCVAGAIAPSDTDPGHLFADVLWVPTTAGTHKITVNQRGSSSITVTVVAAPPGSGTPQPPTQSSCHDSSGSGSSNLLSSGSAGF
ncbi:hypothetical protein [Nocardia sp. NPDC059228]|uniref:hypothetical protein n=1 Tax=Nocardia sp. NPDC059228 TaxID=3346777 RepID=UPI00368CB232